MEDLSLSADLDQRSLKMVRALLSGRPTSFVSEKDRILSDNLLILKKLDKEIPGGLIDRLRISSSYVSVMEAALFLINAHKLKRLNSALDVLRSMNLAEISGNFDQLMFILKETDSMPAGWAIALWGHEIEDRYERAQEDSKWNDNWRVGYFQ